MDEKYFDELIKEGYIEIFADIPENIEHNCFVCSKKNPIGLKLRFFTDSKREIVISIYEISKNYCGFPNISHGGILATLIDELMAYVLHLKYDRYGITKSLIIQYKKPVLINQPILIKAQIIGNTTQALEKNKNNEIDVSGKIYNLLKSPKEENLCVKAVGKLVLLADKRYDGLYHKTLKKS